MRGAKTFSPAAAAVEFVPLQPDRALDLIEVFGRDAPLEVDLGCGDGAYLAELAARDPARNFLGIERLAGRIRSACNKIVRQQLQNARVLRDDSAHAVAHLLPPESVAVFHLLFPDPWPKRRHHRRRVVDVPFLESIAAALQPSGLLSVATDHRDYFEEISASAAKIVTLVPVKSDELHDLPISTFEQRFRDAGAPIHRLLLRKASGVR